jgi:mRNA interferase HigB
MRIVSRGVLVGYWEKHPETEASLQHWINVAKGTHWATPAEVLASFPKAKVINADRVWFEVHGGDYRLIVAFFFAAEIAFIKFVGAHAEYDRIDAETVSLF